MNKESSKSTALVRRIVQTCKRAAGVRPLPAKPRSNPSLVNPEISGAPVGLASTPEDISIISQSLYDVGTPNFLSERNFSLRVTGWRNRNLFSPTNLLAKARREIESTLEKLESADFRISAPLAVLVSAHPGSLKIHQDLDSTAQHPSFHALGLNGYSMPIFLSASERNTWEIAQGDSGAAIISTTPIGKEFRGEAFHLLVLTPQSNSQHAIDYSFSTFKMLAALTASKSRRVNRVSLWPPTYNHLVAYLASDQAHGVFPSPFILTEPEAGAMEIEAPLLRESRRVRDLLMSVGATIGHDRLSELIKFIDRQDLRSEAVIPLLQKKSESTSLTETEDTEAEYWLEGLDELSQHREAEADLIERLIKSWLMPEELHTIKFVSE